MTINQMVSDRLTKEQADKILDQFVEQWIKYSGQNFAQELIGYVYDMAFEDAQNSLSDWNKPL